uniref:Uncharacterized protein n=1 Tax=Tanacetum cinerariifolium TaxID=118510 RepID=A0A699HK49_TANCI|nr:hypothetical protein CTI12_AA564490 [Tanacetum cinerariifolium]
MEIFAVVTLLRSDWTDHWLSQHNYTRNMLVFLLLKKPTKLRWSGSTAKLDLISVALEEKPTSLMQIQKFFGIDKNRVKHCYKTYRNVSDNLKSLVYNQFLEFIMKVNSDPIALCSHKGSFSLRENKCDKLLWSITKVAFDQSILIRHVATTLYYSDLESDRDHTDINVCRVESKHLSDYLLHLLVAYPVMLPMDKGPINEKDEACQKLLQVDCTEVWPKEVKGDRSKSALFEGCRLASSLKEMKRGDMWKITSQVWIEMLAYAATHCRGFHHAQQLQKGATELFEQPRRRILWRWQGMDSISKVHSFEKFSYDVAQKDPPVYAPPSTSREYTLKTQLLRIDMHGDETLNAYSNRAQEYDDALAAIAEPVKNKDLVMLAVSDLHEEYNGLKTITTNHQSPTAFSELHALLSDHDYMLGKTRAPASSITSSFAANYVVGSPSMLEARQAQLSKLSAQLSAFEFQVYPLHHLVHKPFMVLANQTTKRVTITTTVAIATTLVVTTTTEVVVMVINLIGHGHKTQWRQAMKEEYDALVKNEMLSLVPRASNTNVVESEHGMLICHSSGSNLQAITGMLWKGNPDTSLEAFLDADWVGDSDD